MNDDTYDDDIGPFIVRFADKIDPATSEPDGCWHWTAAVDDRGRPRIKIAGRTEHAPDIAARITHDIILPWPVIGPVTAFLMCDLFVSYIANQTLHGIAAAAEKMPSQP